MDSIVVVSSRSLVLERNGQVGSRRFLSPNLTIPVLGIDKARQVSICSLPSLRSTCSFTALRRGQSQSQPHLNRGALRSRKVIGNFTSRTIIAEAVSTTREAERLENDEINGVVLLQNADFLSPKNLAFLNIPFFYGRAADALNDFWNKRKVSLELVSRDQVDPATGSMKTSGYSDLKWTTGFDSIETRCKIKFKWNSTLGFPGAFCIKNMHARKFLLKSLTIFVPGRGEIHFHCNSWIFPFRVQPIDRVFFANESFLPEDTPVGLTKLRELDLKFLRGDGTKERKVSDRIYDYDVYNDIGEADTDGELGGSQKLPYPRRCSTGHPRIETAPNFETSTSSIYIPPDEKLPYADFIDFKGHLLLSFTNLIIPELIYRLEIRVFKTFEDVIRLFEQRSKSAADSRRKLRRSNSPVKYMKRLVRELLRDMRLTKFRRPDIIEAHESAWRSDEEFARQTLAGVNPTVIQCLQDFPLSSNLDEEMYGPQKSAITYEHIRENLEGLSADQATTSKRLFIVDYYDAYMPYVERINTLRNDVKIYASRTVYFLTKERTLKPVAIELCLPKIGKNAAVRRVCTPGEYSTEGAVWQLAKVYVKVNEAGYHQLVSHWLRTHCIMEPFIIATHRQLSKMHPVYKLLIPHYLGTLHINQTARQNLINASGIIERTFATGSYSMEMTSNAYKQWKFKEQGLEADLLKRGMAVRDAEAPNGFKLVIEDYPYAVDGIEIWFALKEWVSEYLKIYYKDDASVKKDKELQAWWDEIVNVGHADLKDDPSRWYRMDTLDDAKQIATTIIWTASALHAAVNFGQYSYGGYVPNLPTISRRLIPDRETPEYDELLQNPERFLIDTLPTPEQAFRVMAVLEVLSKHAKNEVYLGQSPGSTTDWVDDERVKEIFTKFSNKLKKIEEEIEGRNKNDHYKNRNGPAKIPYTLLFPSTSDLSKTGGLTDRGVPNSISI